MTNTLSATPRKPTSCGRIFVRAMDEGFEANAHRWVVLNEIAARAYFPHKPRENTEKQI
jgi:hypothetical protein